jgi:cold shock CspA family protein
VVALDERKGTVMPTGKVKWYDSEKGFGFLSREGGEDVYVRAEALPQGVTTLKAGTRVEFGIGAATRPSRSASSTRLRRSRRRRPRRGASRPRRWS